MITKELLLECELAELEQDVLPDLLASVKDQGATDDDRQSLQSEIGRVKQRITQIKVALGMCEHLDCSIRYEWSNRKQSTIKWTYETCSKCGHWRRKKGVRGLWGEWQQPTPRLYDATK